MKDIVKMITFILLISVLLISCSNDKCKSDNEGLCELEKVATLEIEAAAHITIAVLNQDYGEDLVSNWDNHYPEYAGLLNFELFDPTNSGELLAHISDYDLINLKTADVPLYFDYLMPFDISFSNILENESLNKFSSQINQEENYFMPFDIEGLLFAYNKTMLEDFGVDLIDEDNNGLADAIDSFEKISDLAKTWRIENKTYLEKPIENIFAFPLNDQMAMLPFLQNNNYRLIQGTSAEMMDLEEGLLKALEHLQTLGAQAWRFDQNVANDTVWNYEQVLVNQSAPFLLVGNWMYYDHYQTSKAYELVFTKLPTLNGEDLATVSSVSGFVLNKDTKYPNAANMVLKHIKSVEGAQIAINNGVIPLINPNLLNVSKLKIDDNTKQQIKAYQFSETSPLQAFEQKPEIRGWDILLENDFREQISLVFLGEITPKVAQKEIRAIISEWLDEKAIMIEGLSNLKDASEEDKNDDLGKDN